jgi:hypothetical protein
MGGGYEGQRHSGEGLFGGGNFGERKLFFLRLGTVFSGLYFLVWSLGGLLHGCIGCWEFWARGPGILMESWS